MKEFLQVQCKLMVDIKKFTFLREIKLIPNVDISNPYSLKGWSILRQVSLDYGKQYFL